MTLPSFLVAALFEERGIQQWTGHSYANKWPGLGLPLTYVCVFFFVVAIWPVGGQGVDNIK